METQAAWSLLTQLRSFDVTTQHKRSCQILRYGSIKRQRRPASHRTTQPTIANFDLNSSNSGPIEDQCRHEQELRLLATSSAQPTISLPSRGTLPTPLAAIQFNIRGSNPRSPFFRFLNHQTWEESLPSNSSSGPVHYAHCPILIASVAHPDDSACGRLLLHSEPSRYTRTACRVLCLPCEKV